MKINAPTGCRKKYQTCFCCSTIVFKSSVPATSTSATSDRPIANSYDTICADERSPPSIEYLLLLAQPPSTMPYTLIDVIAKTYNRPTLRFGAMVSGISNPNRWIVPPSGMTANTTIAGIAASIGARMNVHLSARSGTTSSLKINFTPSANGWSKPYGPARLGPTRV